MTRGLITRRRIRFLRATAWAAAGILLVFASANEDLAIYKSQVGQWKIDAALTVACVIAMSAGLWLARWLRLERKAPSWSFLALVICGLVVGRAVSFLSGIVLYVLLYLVFFPIYVIFGR